VVSLLARRRAPLAVLAITGAATFIGLVGRSMASAVIGFPVLVALYTVDTRCSRRKSLGASAVALAGAIVAAALSRHVPAALLLEMSIAPAAVIVALWVIGDNLRVRRAYVAGLEERAAWVDAQRAAEARRAAEDERARIARELHDVVAHHVAVMAVQAGAARMLNGAVDEQTRDMLGSIESTAHQAMSELRRLLGVLRREESAAQPAGQQQPGAQLQAPDGSGQADPGVPAGPVPGPNSPAPQPGLAQIRQLVDQVRRAGLPVELTEAGVPRGLPDWVDVSAYRIVQEALTNVLKHAGHARTQVCLRSDASEVTLRVTNAVPPGARVPAGDRPGHGLIGMRERVAMAGGELRTGPTGDGGFEVFARLPAWPAGQAPRAAQLAGGRS
jgi:signal transduction histidine kinase